MNSPLLRTPLSTLRYYLPSPIKLGVMVIVCAILTGGFFTYKHFTTPPKIQVKEKIVKVEEKIVDENTVKERDELAKKLDEISKTPSDPTPAPPSPAPRAPAAPPQPQVFSPPSSPPVSSARLSRSGTVRCDISSTIQVNASGGSNLHLTVNGSPAAPGSLHTGTVFNIVASAENTVSFSWNWINGGNCG